MSLHMLILLIEFGICIDFLGNNNACLEILGGALKKSKVWISSNHQQRDEYFFTSPMRMGWKGPSPANLMLKNTHSHSCQLQPSQMVERTVPTNFYWHECTGLLSERSLFLISTSHQTFKWGNFFWAFATTLGWRTQHTSPWALAIASEILASSTEGFRSCLDDGTEADENGWKDARASESVLMARTSNELVLQVWESSHWAYPSLRARKNRQSKFVKTSQHFFLIHGS